MKRNVDEEIEKWMKCPDVPDELKHEILNIENQYFKNNIMTKSILLV